MVVEVGADGGDRRGDRPGVGDGDAAGLPGRPSGADAARPRRRRRGRPVRLHATRERPGPDPRRPGSTPASAMAGGGRIGPGAGRARCGATTPGRSVDRRRGGRAARRAGAVAVQNPEAGVSGAAGGRARRGSDQPVAPTGVAGVNSSPAIRGIGPVMSARADHRDAAGSLGDVFGLDDRQLTGRGVGRGVLGEPAATGVGDHALRARHHRLERRAASTAPGSRSGSCDLLVRRTSRRTGRSPASRPRSHRHGHARHGAAHAQRRRPQSSLTLVGPGRGSESRSRRPRGRVVLGERPGTVVTAMLGSVPHPGFSDHGTVTGCAEAGLDAVTHRERRTAPPATPNEGPLRPTHRPAGRTAARRAETPARRYAERMTRAARRTRPRTRGERPHRPRQTVGLVGPAAVRVRGEERGVGLDEELVVGHERGGLAQRRARS